MEFNILSILAVIVVAFLAGMEGILDQFPIPPTNYCLFLSRACNGSSQRCIILRWGLN